MCLLRRRPHRGPTPVPRVFIFWLSQNRVAPIFFSFGIFRPGAGKQKRQLKFGRKSIYTAYTEIAARTKIFVPETGVVFLHSLTPRSDWGSIVAK